MLFTLKNERSSSSSSDLIRFSFIDRRDLFAKNVQFPDAHLSERFLSIFEFNLYWLFSLTNAGFCDDEPLREQMVLQTLGQTKERKEKVLANCSLDCFFFGTSRLGYSYLDMASISERDWETHTFPVSLSLSLLLSLTNSDNFMTIALQPWVSREGGSAIVLMSSSSSLEQLTVGHFILPNTMKNNPHNFQVKKQKDMKCTRVKTQVSVHWFHAFLWQQRQQQKQNVFQPQKDSHRRIKFVALIPRRGWSHDD